MKIALVTDAWQPQVNGVVTTLVELVQSLRAGADEIIVIEPGQFRTRPCPGYPGIDLAVRPGSQVRGLLDRAQPDAVHIATEGRWAGPRGAIACAAAGPSPRPSTRSSPRSCTPPSGCRCRGAMPSSATSTGPRRA